MVPKERAIREAPRSSKCQAFGLKIGCPREEGEESPFMAKSTFLQEGVASDLLKLPQSNMKCTMCFTGFEVESFVDKLFGPMSRPRTQGADE